MTLADLENPEHVGVPQRRTKVLRGGRRQHAHLHHREKNVYLSPPSESAS